MCAIAAAMPSKPKRWLLGDEDERFKLYHYEAPDGSGSALWIVQVDAGLHPHPLQCVGRRVAEA
jgi:hypothetical protein